jgi:hypothetical protein
LFDDDVPCSVEVAAVRAGPRDVTATTRPRCTSPSGSATGRVFHSTEREGTDGVVEEEEPADLRARRRRLNPAPVAAPY